MKLVSDPMPALRRAKADKVNIRFNEIASSRLHMDQAHRQKREWAANKDSRLKDEAQLRQITIEDLANLILAKPDTIAQRELSRQQAMMKIDQAQTPEELDAI